MRFARLENNVDKKFFGDKEEVFWAFSPKSDLL